MKILIVEAETFLSEKLNSFFREQEYSFDICKTFMIASENISLYEYDCIILNSKLPDGDALSLLDQLTENNKTDGIIIISGKNSIEERIMALDLGADDYLNIPFDFAELHARVKAIIRRKKFNTKNKLHFANLVIDFQTKTVCVWENPINLTKKEYEILLHLIANKGRVISKTSLAEYLWGENADNIDSYNFLFAHIKNLKKKLRSAKAELEIKNIYNVGYQISEL